MYFTAVSVFKFTSHHHHNEAHHMGASSQKQAPWNEVPLNTIAKQAKSLDEIMRDLRTFGQIPGEKAVNEGDNGIFFDDEELDGENNELIEVQNTKPKKSGNRYSNYRVVPVENESKSSSATKEISSENKKLAKIEAHVDLYD